MKVKIENVSDCLKEKEKQSNSKVMNLLKCKVNFKMFRFLLTFNMNLR